MRFFNISRQCSQKKREKRGDHGRKVSVFSLTTLFFPPHLILFYIAVVSQHRNQSLFHQSLALSLSESPWNLTRISFEISLEASMSPLHLNSLSVVVVVVVFYLCKVATCGAAVLPAPPPYTPPLTAALNLAVCASPTAISNPLEVRGASAAASNPSAKAPPNVRPCNATFHAPSTRLFYTPFNRR